MLDSLAFIIALPRDSFPPTLIIINSSSKSNTHRAYIFNCYFGVSIAIYIQLIISLQVEYLLDKLSVRDIQNLGKILLLFFWSLKLAPLVDLVIDIRKKKKI